ncbi:hypothetical protein PCC6311_2366 [Synechococcus elongatus PCC 6311]|uniref:Uncharacterized protein n=2 Tax=Synechococcus elongatus TaxID=32046 RepID=Q31KW2_SYNE7|nr:conserved hypothetical protein [Synechococcus elongatus PCC 7942 = FACHB-805]UOW72106.1 hypothetical protein PCC7943_2368 [Synechococcus elongatus PCC 7943]UOW74825.1 hypothetical protein PCC6311_2366 [Synechococcus elongatus PCC 6311]UOW77546.1 hypothetical protein PCC6301pg_2368 [Synechococcus elongatus PCC 6301]BAD80013.1 unknown protein [Synechococcus elongatus PCC 6301]
MACLSTPINRTAPTCALSIPSIAPNSIFCRLIWLPRSLRQNNSKKVVQMPNGNHRLNWHKTCCCNGRKQQFSICSCGYGAGQVGWLGLNNLRSPVRNSGLDA